MPKNINKSPFEKYIYSQFVGYFFIFAILFFSLVFETYRVYVLQQRNTISQDLIIHLALIAASSALITLFMTQLSKFTVVRLIVLAIDTHIKKPIVQANSKFPERLNDIYISILFAVIFQPIRPVLQYTQWSESKNFYSYFAKHDAYSTALLLSLVALPIIFYHLLKTPSYLAKKYTAMILLSIIVAMLINMQPNFNLNIYKSRRAWIEKDFSTLANQAQTSLDNASTDQEQATAYYWMGVAANRQKNYSQAVLYQLKAIKIMPTYGAPYSSLSMAYLHLGDLEKSKRAGEQCLIYSPDYAWCHYALGAYYDATGDLTTSHKHFTHAIQLDPDSPDLREAYEYSKNHQQ